MLMMMRSLEYGLKSISGVYTNVFTNLSIWIAYSSYVFRLYEFNIGERWSCCQRHETANGTSQSNAINSHKTCRKNAANAADLHVYFGIHMIHCIHCSRHFVILRVQMVQHWCHIVYQRVFGWVFLFHTIYINSLDTFFNKAPLHSKKRLQFVQSRHCHAPNQRKMRF